MERFTNQELLQPSNVQGFLLPKPGLKERKGMVSCMFPQAWKEEVQRNLRFIPRVPVTSALQQCSLKVESGPKHNSESMLIIYDVENLQADYLYLCCTSNYCTI